MISVESEAVNEAAGILKVKVFSDWDKLTTAKFIGKWTLPNTTAGTELFTGCESLTSVEFEDITNTDIGSTFLGCTSNSITLTIPNSVTELFYNDYRYMKEIKSDVIKVEGNIITSTVTNDDVTDCKLLYCARDLSSVTVPATITSVSETAFALCSDLTSVVWQSSASIPDGLFYKCKNLEEIEFSAGAYVKSIGAGAFEDTVIKKVVLPTTIETIGDNAFENCIYLTEISFESNSSLTSITLNGTGSAFLDCPALSKISIENNAIYSTPDSIMVVQKDGDSNVLKMVCGNAKTITVPSEVTSVEIDAFYGCLSLTSILVESGNTNYSSEDGFLLDDTGTTLMVVPNALTDVVIPDSVSIISLVGTYENPFKYVTQVTNFTWVTDGDATFETTLFNGNRDGFDIDTVRIEAKHITCDSRTLLVQVDVDYVFLTCDEYNGHSILSGISDVSAVVNIEKSSLTNGKGLFYGTYFKSLTLTLDKSSLEYIFAGSDSIPFTVDENEPTNTVWSINGEVISVEEALDELLDYKVTFDSGDLDDLVWNVTSVTYKGASYNENRITFSIDSNVSSRSIDITANGTPLDNSSSYTYKLEGDTTFAASLNSARATLTFNMPGGETEEVSIIYGMCIQESDIPLAVESEMVFRGWYTDEGLTNAFNSSLPIETDKELYARFIPVAEDGVDLTFSLKHGTASVTYSSGDDTVVVYSGDTIENGTTVVISFTPMNGFEFEHWIVNGNISNETSESLSLQINEDTYVTTELRNYSNSSSVIGLTDLPTVSYDSSFSLLWSNQYAADISGMNWKGMPGTPLIVGNYVYLRQFTSIYKLDITTGETVASAETKLNGAFYQHIGYGNGLIVDYMTGKVYDLDLVYQYTLEVPSETMLSVVVYSDGYFYGASSGHLWKYDSSNGGIVKNEGWENGVECNWFGLYGAMSTPVVIDNNLYIVEVSGDNRYIGHVNLETGEHELYEVESISGMYLDDGWLSTCNYGGTDYLFITAYGAGLFANDAVKADASIIASVKLDSEGKFVSDSERYIYTYDGEGEENAGAASAVIVFNDRGYVHVGGLLYVLDIAEYLDSVYSDDGTWSSKISNSSKVCEYCDQFVYYREQDSYSHSGIVVSICDYEETGNVYIYTNPYQGSQSLIRVFCDYEGKSEATGFVETRENGSFGSQIVRIGPDGEMILYSDDGVLYCFIDIRCADYDFLIHDEDGAEWISGQGTDAEEALVDALTDNEIYFTHNEEGDITINGEAVWSYVYTNEWISIELDDTELKDYRTYMISSVVTTAAIANNYSDGLTYSCLTDGVLSQYTIVELMYDSSIEGAFTHTPYCTVTFDANGAVATSEFTDEVYVVSGGTIGSVDGSNLSMQGYDFVGWYCNGTPYSFGTTVDSDLTLTAIWEWKNGTPVESVTISGNGVEVSEGSKVLSMSEADTVQLSIIFKGEDGKNVSIRKVSWTSSDPSVATVDSEGMITAKSYGNAIITATSRDGGKTDSVSVTVGYGSVCSVTIDPALSLTSGGSSRISLDYTDVSVKSIEWSSNDTKVAIVDQNGNVTAVSEGSAVISVKVTGVDGSSAGANCVVNVSKIEVSSISISGSYSLVEKNSSVLVVNISPSNAADKTVVWSSSNTSVATVDQNGVVTAVSAGTAVITARASDGSGVTGTCTVTVTALNVTVTLSATSKTIDVNGMLSLVATVGPSTITNKNVVWSSSNTSVATVGSNGLVTAVSSGTAVITATSVEGSKSASCTVTVKGDPTGIYLDKTSLSLKKDGMATVVASLSPLGIEGYNIVWSSSDLSVATVSDGLITATGNGTAIITATVSGTDVSATCTVLVTNSHVSEDKKTSDDGKTTTTTTEDIDVGNGTTVSKKKIAVTDTAGDVESEETTISVVTDGSDVVTRISVVSNGSNSKATAETNIPATVTESNGKLSASVSNSDMENAVKQIIAANGAVGSDLSSNVTINLVRDSDVGTVVAKIPMSSVNSILDGTSSGVEIVTDIGTVSVSPDVLETLSGYSGSDVSMTVGKVDSKDLTEVQKSKVGDYQVYELSTKVGSTGVHELGGEVTVTLPYELKDGQVPSNVVVYYVNDSGELTEVSCAYDSETKTVSFVTDHFSEYVVGYGLSSSSVSDSGITTTDLILTVVIAGIVAAFIGAIVGTYVVKRGRV